MAPGHLCLPCIAVSAPLLQHWVSQTSCLSKSHNLLGILQRLWHVCSGSMWATPLTYLTAVGLLHTLCGRGISTRSASELCWRFSSYCNMYYATADTCRTRRLLAHLFSIISPATTVSLHLLRRGGADNVGYKPGGGHFNRNKYSSAASLTNSQLL